MTLAIVSIGEMARLRCDDVVESLDERDVDRRKVVRMADREDEIDGERIVVDLLNDFAETGFNVSAMGIDV